MSMKLLQGVANRAALRSRDGKTTIRLAFFREPGQVRATM
jgi:hypothetical protein